MTSPAELLAAYDAQLRTAAETGGAQGLTRLGPLHLATFTGRGGFVTYRDLGDADEHRVRELVVAAKSHFENQTDVARAEWKTRGHDHAPGLHEALVENGFEPDEPESIMVGEARLLALDLDLPDGIVLRQVHEEADIRAMCAMQGEVFGDDPAEIEAMADSIVRHSGTDDSEMWIAEADGQVISAGRLSPVADSDFAGIWGGSTRPEWRGRGVYRALTAARAKSALRLGKRFINSDSTEFSRPILERSGLVKVSTTTPYLWRRDAGETVKSQNPVERRHGS
ncbi:GNAT family N-acetyltransferase [Nocardioides sp. JQ2195]|uniref:GNAT family N-acetyltransferase n=1 Tax=Nocardioides sp. JQ2195 TaxID=2592334 RepID=UPI00143E53CB|nr:GNAT family N-acetyltransferase [Nocardioides sp. JQ2195]QIX27709.1 GNAT family N-acetyltransferase [Nocardioides sp. JQ2195]